MGQARTAHAIDDFQQVCYFNQKKKKKTCKTPRSRATRKSPPRFLATCTGSEGETRTALSGDPGKADRGQGVHSTRAMRRRFLSLHLHLPPSPVSPSPS